MLRHPHAPLPPARHRGPSRLVAVAVAVALGVGCAPDAELQDELAALRRDLAASEAERAELEARVAATEDVLAELSADDSAITMRDRLDETDAELVRLVDALTVLEEELAIIASDSTATADEVSAALADLRGSLSGVQGDVEAARGDLELLDTLYATLRERLDRLDVRVSRLGG